MTLPRERHYLKHIVTGMAIFGFALGLRLLYQSESVVDQPIRADAAKYVTAAYNVRYFGIYSLDTPDRGSRPPSGKTDLSPGYPLFLALFAGKHAIHPSVLKVQAVMGALVCVFAFVLARMALPYPYALASGILTSLCPHLIALDYYLLTESLFTFVLMLGLVTLAFSWWGDRYILTLAAGFLLALSSHVRAVNMLIVLWLAPVFFIRARERQLSSKSRWIPHVAVFLAGMIVVTACHRTFMHQTQPHTQGGAQSEEGSNGGDVGYTDPSQALDDWKRSLVPPRFYVKGESHVMMRHGNRTYRYPIKGGFWEYPAAYLKWNLWGRLFVLWHWDNAYNGDVYIYPMIRKGFEVDRVLKTIHRVMRSLHWPLFLLSLAAPAMLFVKWKRKTLAVRERMLLVSASAFLYLVGVVWLIAWFPRYTIPARPLSYILASASLCWLIDFMRNRRVSG